MQVIALERVKIQWNCQQQGRDLIPDRGVLVYLKLKVLELILGVFQEGHHILLGLLGHKVTVFLVAVQVARGAHLVDLVHAQRSLDKHLDELLVRSNRPEHVLFVLGKGKELDFDAW